MATISGALARIQENLAEHLPEESILAACRAAGHEWRERKLGPVATVQLFMLQALWFNTAIEHLRHLAGYAFNAAAYCKARLRLPLEVLQTLLLDSSASMRAVMGDAAGPDAASPLWRGLRAFLVDGSSTITPDTPELQKAFGQPSGQKPGCGFPVPKTLGLFDAFIPGRRWPNSTACAGRSRRTSRSSRRRCGCARSRARPSRACSRNWRSIAWCTTWCVR